MLSAIWRTYLDCRLLAEFDDQFKSLRILSFSSEVNWSLRGAADTGISMGDALLERSSIPITPGGGGGIPAIGGGGIPAIGGGGIPAIGGGGIIPAGGVGGMTAAGGGGIIPTGGATNSGGVGMPSGSAAASPPGVSEGGAGQSWNASPLCVAGTA